MKRFICKITITIIVTFLFVLILDYTICQGLLNINEKRFQDYAAILKGGMNNDVLIMGNSRATAQFDTYLIDSICNLLSFNIGIDAYPFNVQLMKYKLYREYNKKPKVIIQNVDHHTFKCFSHIKYQFESEQFFPLIYDRCMRKELRNLGYGNKELFIPMYRMYGYLKVNIDGLLGVGIKQFVSRSAYKGYRPLDYAWDEEGYLTKWERHELSLSDTTKLIFEQFLSDCKSDSIFVILVHSPCYYELPTEKWIGFSDVQDYFKCVANRYGFVYLDYTIGNPISEDKANFCDPIHMNKKASELFTKQLCDDMIKMSLLPQ